MWLEDEVNVLFLGVQLVAGFDGGWCVLVGVGREKEGFSHVPLPFFFSFLFNYYTCGMPQSQVNCYTSVDSVKIGQKVTIANGLNLRGAKFLFFLLGDQNRNIGKLRGSNCSLTYYE